MLQKLLEMKLSQAVQEQLRAGVGPVPKEHADELLRRGPGPLRANPIEDGPLGGLALLLALSAMGRKH